MVGFFLFFGGVGEGVINNKLKASLICPGQASGRATPKSMLTGSVDGAQVWSNLFQ